MSGRVERVRRGGGACAFIYDWDDGWVVNVAVEVDGRCLSLRCSRCAECNSGCLLGDVVAVTGNGDVVRVKVSRLRVCRAGAEQQHPAEAVSLCVAQGGCDDYGVLTWSGVEAVAVGEEKRGEGPKVKVAGYFASVRFEAERWAWEALGSLHEACGL